MKWLDVCMFGQKVTILFIGILGAVRPVVIPKYKEVPTFVIKNNMIVIGMSREKYLELMERA